MQIIDRIAINSRHLLVNGTKSIDINSKQYYRFSN